MNNFNKIVFALLILCTIIPAASGAKIFGYIYDWSSLEPLDKVLVEINSQPIQRVISTNGYYSFDIPLGSYSITAFYVKSGKVELSADENITISSDGEFELDLMLFPPLGEIDSLDELINADIEIQIDENVLDEPVISNSQDILFPILLLILIIFISFGFHYLNKNKKLKADSKSEQGKSEIHFETIELPENEKKSEKSEDLHLDDSAKEVLKVIKESGNRLTQRELRDKIPSMGEAKISLIIAELESHGLVKKIKKGRGNIIVLKQ
ncbi:MAG: hypothetical protein AABW72_05640 [archaeon]|mgnify:CR=1 FL=1